MGQVQHERSRIEPAASQEGRVVGVDRLSPNSGSFGTRECSRLTHTSHAFTGDLSVASVTHHTFGPCFGAEPCLGLAYRG